MSKENTTPAELIYFDSNMCCTRFFGTYLSSVCIELAIMSKDILEMSWSDTEEAARRARHPGEGRPRGTPRCTAGGPAWGSGALGQVMVIHFSKGEKARKSMVRSMQ